VQQLIRKAQSGLQLSEVDDMAIAGVLSAQLTYHHFVKDFHHRLSPITDSDRVKVINNMKEELTV
jgi:asparagine synthase (glutamine-hydrolysing)